MKTKVLSILLTLVLVFSLIPMGFADTAAEPCNHEHTENAFFDRDVTYTDTGDNWGHVESGIRVFFTYCEDCYATLSEQEEPFTETVSHVYDENNVCVFCGHENACAHENTFEVDVWGDGCTYTDLGSVHEVSGMREWYSVCEDCGAWILERSEYMVAQEPHDYVDDGTCQFCGHENTCSHEHYYEDWYWDPYRPVVFTDTGDNLTHEASGTRVWYRYCTDCGQSFEHRTEEYTGPDAHSYDENGVCFYCGHVQTVAIRTKAVKGGSVHGAGTYHVGETVTLAAKAFKGFVFGYWMEDGEIVCKKDTYTFTAEADRTLTPVFFLKGARIDPVVRPIDPIKPITPIKPIGTVR